MLGFNEACSSSSFPFSSAFQDALDLPTSIDQFSVDELFDSLVQSLDAATAESSGVSPSIGNGSPLLQSGVDDQLSGLLGDFNFGNLLGLPEIKEECNTTAEQLFASIDASSTADFSRHVGSGEASAQATTTGASCPAPSAMLMMMEDHDYIRRDYVSNNNHQQMQPDLFTNQNQNQEMMMLHNNNFPHNPMMQNKIQNPISPLSNYSSSSSSSTSAISTNNASDFGYESDSKSSNSSSSSSPSNNNNTTTSPLGVPLEYEDEYLMGLGLDMMDTPMLDSLTGDHDIGAGAGFMMEEMLFPDESFNFTN